MGILGSYQPVLTNLCFCCCRDAACRSVGWFLVVISFFVGIWTCFVVLRHVVGVCPVGSVQTN